LTTGRKASQTALAAAAALVAAACATKSDVVELQTSIQTDMAAMEARQDSFSNKLELLRQDLLAALESQEQRTLVGGSELQRQLDDMRLMLTQLQELSGQNQRWLMQLQDLAQRAGVQTPESRDDRGDRTDAAAAGDAQDSPAGPGDPARLYEASLQQYRRGSYETARAGFDEFLSDYPTHALAPDAQYYRAETFAQEGDPDAALREFARVLELYPNSRRAPTALYRSGIIEVERGRRDDAALFFTRIVQGYPDSDEATLAEDQLRRLSQ
jgi:tol-pal system protein YbgF